MVEQTGQPYLFTNDNPLNSTDPLGLCVRAGKGRCLVASGSKKAPKKGRAPGKSAKSKSTIGNVFLSISTATANGGLFLDVTGAGAASTGVGLEPGVELWSAGFVLNSISTGTGCAAGIFNGETLAQAVKNCGNDVTIQIVTESRASGSLLQELGKWYGDVQTAVWDLHRLPN